MKLKFQKKLLLKDVVQLLKISSKSFNPFYATSLYLYPMKTSEKLKFSDFLGGKETGGMKWVNEDSRFKKAACMQAQNATTDVLKQNLLWFLKNYNQLYLVLTIAYEGFTNSFSTKAFVERLSIMPWKKDSWFDFIKTRWILRSTFLIESSILNHINQCFNFSNKSVGISDVFRT